MAITEIPTRPDAFYGEVPEEGGGSDSKVAPPVSDQASRFGMSVTAIHGIEAPRINNGITLPRVRLAGSRAINGANAVTPELPPNPNH